MLLPECLDDYVDEASPVRVVDAFVDMQDLASLGFSATPEATGRPGYHPGLMLRTYLYGCLNQVESSRRLERECGRNLELIWLTGPLKPHFKTIADSRRDNGPAIRKVCQQFIALCRDIKLLDAGVVAIDGSLFKALNEKAKNFTREKLRRKLAEIDAAIDRYMAELDRADEVLEKTGSTVPTARLERAGRKLAHLGPHASKASIWRNGLARAHLQMRRRNHEEPAVRGGDDLDRSGAEVLGVEELGGPSLRPRLPAARYRGTI